MSLKYTLVGEEDGTQSITVIVPPDFRPLVANSDHPNFTKIVREVTLPEGDATTEKIVDLFDIGAAVQKQFEKLSERVSVYGGHIFFDGDSVDDSLTSQILRFLDEEVFDWEPLVYFMEKINQNPSEHSRRQLYDWLQRNQFTIAPDGDIIGYKGVRKTDVEGVFKSTFGGCAIVDGEVLHGRIPNKAGSVVEMPRSDVAFDPGVACSTGLHVANFDYASRFGDAVLEVRVNPRDVVSVPELDAQKMRVCRYYIEGTTTESYTGAVLEEQPEVLEVAEPIDLYFDTHATADVA